MEIKHLSEHIEITNHIQLTNTVEEWKAYNIVSEYLENVRSAIERSEYIVNEWDGEIITAEELRTTACVIDHIFHYDFWKAVEKIDTIKE